MPKRSKKNKQQRTPVFNTVADALLVKRAIKQGWPTSRRNQRQIIDDLCRMIPDADTIPDIVGPDELKAISRALTVSDVLMFADFTARSRC